MQNPVAREQDCVGTEQPPQQFDVGNAAMGFRQSNQFDLLCRCQHLPEPLHQRGLRADAFVNNHSGNVCHCSLGGRLDSLFILHPADVKRL